MDSPYYNNGQLTYFLGLKACILSRLPSSIIKKNSSFGTKAGSNGFVDELIYKDELQICLENFLAKIVHDIIVRTSKLPI